MNYIVLLTSITLNIGLSFYLIYYFCHKAINKLYFTQSGETKYSRALREKPKREICIAIALTLLNFFNLAVFLYYI